MATTVDEVSRKSPRRATGRPKKSEGQWAVDGRQPLNEDEKIKQERSGLSVVRRVTEIYSKEGWDSFEKEDLIPRMKWMGLYTQRRQDLGTEHTGHADAYELSDRYFMMRIRLDGGLASPERLRVIGEISRDYARSTADLTDRQNIQLHWIQVEDIPTIWGKLETVGLNTAFGAGDVPRVILGSPVAGVAKDEIIDATPAIEEIHRRYIGTEEFANLPRKFKSAISGNSRQDVTHEIQDLAFIGSVHPEYGPGFETFVGGGLSTNPTLAQSLGNWCSLEEVPEIWAAAVKLFQDYGYRRNRKRARLKFLIKDLGLAEFTRILEEEYLGHPLTPGPHNPINPGYRDHVGRHEQKDGTYYLGVKPLVGHIPGEQLIRVADIADTYGVTRIRLTTNKELLFLDVDKEKLDALSQELRAVGLEENPSEFRRGILTCTGLEFCKLAHTTTRTLGIELIDELEQRLGDLDVPLRIAINGCPNSCARTQIADIGLKGQTIPTENGYAEGFQVHLGGSATFNPNFGRKLRGHKVLASEVGDYIVRVVTKYREQRTEGEQFQQWVVRADEEDLK